MNDVRTRIRRGVAGVLAALALTAGAFTLTGCGQATAADGVAGPEPAVKEEIGDTEISTLTLTPEAVDRLGLMTVEVEGGAGGLTVAYAALIYDHDGDTWVYTNPEPEVFVRAAVEVDRIDGDTAHLTEDPNREPAS